MLLGVCSLGRSDIYGVPLSRPVGPLIVQGSAGLSPNNIEMVIILCKRGTDCEYFLKIIPDLLCLGVQIQLCAGYSSQSEDATPRTETNLVRHWTRIGADILSDNY